MEPKLDELLARLRELDPETWNRLMEFLPAQINRFQDLWILQGVIQDAIAARFWRFEIISEEDGLEKRLERADFRIAELEKALLEATR